MQKTDTHSKTVRTGMLPRQIAPRPGALQLQALLLVLLLSMIAALMAYQAPPSGRVAVGWLGDRLFLGASPNVAVTPSDAADFYNDDLTPDSPTTRSRWTRALAQIHLPNVGRGSNLDLHLQVQGWPSATVGTSVAQPTVSVRANGIALGEFTPTSAWSEFRFVIPAERSGDDLLIELQASHTFTDTATFGADPRPKGVRLAEVRVHAADSTAFYPPALGAVLALALAALLLAWLLWRVVGRLAAVFTAVTLLVGAAAIGLALARIWMAAALNVLNLLLVIGVIAAYLPQILWFTRAFLRRFTQGQALGYGLVAAALAWLGYILARASVSAKLPGFATLWERFPDTLMYGLLGSGVLALVFVLGRDGLPKLSDALVAALGGPRGAPLVLGLFALIWFGYLASIIARLPYVGHADYSDNAVVARNIVAGRGWVVDYVSQFYELIAGTTRPQETWPLLQPVWIAPFFALFGPTNWAAKIPNLIFSTILLLLIYRVGSYIWDRRVGVLAAIFTLTNYLFFRLNIYVTSDLAFVVLNFAALVCIYRWATRRESEVQAVADWRAWLRRERYLLFAGVLTGLMMLQKPSGAMISVGMGLWLLGLQAARWRRENPQWSALRQIRTWLPKLLPLIAWGVLAIAVLSPYLVRNMILFGKPVYSTESYDAWVLGYRGNSGDAWEEIYRVFTPELNGLGLPDRSWILRWGFDASGTKLRTQVSELRDYLIPTWRNLPPPLSEIFGRKEEKNIASATGAWLVLIGVIVALRQRRRLLSLLATAYAPYVVFMMTYWRTDEDRYWVMLMPWLSLFAAWMIWAGYQRLAAIGDRRWAPLGLILALVTAISVVQPSWPRIARNVQIDPGLWQPDIIAYEWLRENTAPDTVMMTRIPWQLNWHAERPAVMIPNTADRDLLLQIARHYNAEYLVLENLQRVKGDAGRQLSPLLRPGDAPVGSVIDGFELVYASPTPDFRVYIYRIPE